MSTELTLYVLQQRRELSTIALGVGTVIAIVLAAFGLPAVVCASIPAVAYSTPNAIWSVKDIWSATKR